MENEESSKENNESKRTYRLKHPIPWDNGKGSELVTEIKFMQPKGKHVKLLKSEPDMTNLLIIASKLSLVSMKFFDELHSEDAIEIAGFVGELL